MKVVVVGSGGREAALVEVLARTVEVVCTPGNPGIEESDPTPVEELVEVGDVDLVVIGPEQPLVDGLDRQRLERLRHLGAALELPLVASGDVHMHSRERRALQDTVTAIREGVTLERLAGREGRVTGGEMADGSTILAELVLVGIGVNPADDLARAAGLDIENGIAVDATGRTSDPAIFAAGDCASFPGPEGRIRLESVPNAIEHAEATAAAMLGDPAPYVARPWFWSDQYDVKLQIAGLNAGYDRVITRPGARPGGLSVWYFRGSRLISIDAMNDPRAYMTAKRWIEAGVSPDPDRVADPAVELKDFA